MADQTDAERIAAIDAREQEIRDANPGDVVVWHDGLLQGASVLFHRKADDTGWWFSGGDGSGISDRVYAEGPYFTVTALFCALDAARAEVGRLRANRYITPSETAEALDDAITRAETAEAEVRAKVAAEIEERRIVCPVHGIPDCSALLNGCSLPHWMSGQRAADATVARGIDPALAHVVGYDDPADALGES